MQRFAEYTPTSLEKAYKHKLLAPLDVGVPVDLINEDVCVAYPSPPPRVPRLFRLCCLPKHRLV